MLTYILLLAQANPDNPLMGLPNPTVSGGSWWPTITAVVSLLIGGVGAAFGAWVKLQDKKIDKDSETKESVLQLEIERLKCEFEQRKEFVDTIIDECKSLRKTLADRDISLSSAYTQINERDRDNAELRAKVTTLEARVKTLEMPNKPSP